MREHPHVGAVRDYLDNAGITPETLRYAATHEALCRSWTFDLLMGLAEVMEQPQVSQQNEDGSWGPAEPLPYIGWKARLEQWFARRGWNRLAGFMASWDERGLG